MTKISILIPFYNAESTLERAIDSILKQSYEHFELILIDNNSSDRSREIADRYVANNARVQCITEARQGVGFAMDAGINHAKYEIIARMDADDFAYKTRIERQIEVLDKNIDVDIVATQVEHIGHHEQTEGFQNFVDWSNKLITHDDIFLNRFVEMPLVNPTVMFRKHLADKYGGCIHADFPEDYEQWLRYMSFGAKVNKIEEPLLKWYDSDTRLTRTDGRYSADAFFRVKAKYLAKQLKEDRHTDVWIWGAGRVSRQRAEHLTENGINILGYIDVKDRTLDNKKPCINYKAFDWTTENIVLSYVGNYGARENIRSFLKGQGKIEGHSYWIVS